MNRFTEDQFNAHFNSQGDDVEMTSDDSDHSKEIISNPIVAMVKRPIESFMAGIYRFMNMY